MMMVVIIGKVTILEIKMRGRMIMLMTIVVSCSNSNNNDGNFDDNNITSNSKTVKVIKDILLPLPLLLL